MAEIILTDKQIEEYIKEKKVIDKSIYELLKLKPKLGHKENQVKFKSENGSNFVIILREAEDNNLDFSVILTIKLKDKKKTFRLCRYNGKSHQHTNNIEKQTFYDFHIHKATERYQEISIKEDKFAIITNRYSTLKEAFECMIVDCNIIPKNDIELPLFS